MKVFLNSFIDDPDPEIQHNEVYPSTNGEGFTVVNQSTFPPFSEQIREGFFILEEKGFQWRQDSSHVLLIFLLL